MTILQSIKELQRLCKQGKFLIWDVGQTTNNTGETWYTGWIHRNRHEAKRFNTDTLTETLQEMLKFAKERQTIDQLLDQAEYQEEA